jgi:hypothetical protein
MIESYNNLLIKENSLDISNQNEQDDNNTFSEISSIQKINTITGINIIDNDTDTEDQSQPLYKIKNIETNTILTESSDKNNKISTSDDISINDDNSDDDNGWDKEADKILEGWHKQLKLLSFIYQWILDNNLKMSNRLHIFSVSLSTFLGIFTSLKIWMQSSQASGLVIDIITALINFFIALITTISKKYIDDKINDSLRIYIHNIDNFLGEITSEYFKMKKYRTRANVFFLKNNSVFTNLLSKAPNISINDMKQGMIEYDKYLKEEEKFYRKIL